jgi:hypothetical protein
VVLLGEGAKIFAQKINWPWPSTIHYFFAPAHFLSCPTQSSISAHFAFFAKICRPHSFAHQRRRQIVLLFLFVFGVLRIFLHYFFINEKYKEMEK